MRPVLPCTCTCTTVHINDSAHWHDNGARLQIMSGSNSQRVPLHPPRNQTDAVTPYMRFADDVFSVRCAMVVATLLGDALLLDNIQTRYTEARKRDVAVSNDTNPTVVKAFATGLAAVEMYTNTRPVARVAAMMIDIIDMNPKAATLPDDSDAWMVTTLRSLLGQATDLEQPSDPAAAALLRCLCDLQEQHS